MYNIDEKFFNEVLKDYSRSIVGRLCKQNETIKDRSDLTNDQKFDILKSFQRELIYQHFRDFKNQIKSYSLGIQYNKFNVPPLDQK